MTSAFFKSPWNFQKLEYSKIQIQKCNQNSNSNSKIQILCADDVRTKIPLGSVRK